MHRLFQGLFTAGAALLLSAATPLAVPAAALAAAPSGQFLHLSDIHFNPFADPTLFPRLNAAPVDQWEGIFRASGVQQPNTDPQTDSNYPLLASTLTAAQPAKPYDYVVVTGDYLAHGFEDQLGELTRDPAAQQAFTAKTVSFVNRMLGQAFPGLPLIATLGNNDSVCGDYQLTPGGDILAPVGADLPVIAKDSAALADFTAGGYYRTPHPVVPKLDFIVLSVFWSERYQDNCGSPAQTPAQDQYTWLAAKLLEQQRAGRKAILLMHIPPGIDGFGSYSHGGKPVKTLWGADEVMLGKVLALLSQYRAQLVGGYAGHTHMDEFRVLADPAPFFAIRMGPSVTPYSGNRPAFTTVTYDPADGSALDYTVTNFSNAAWNPAYTFTTLYGAKRYDAATMLTLSRLIRSDPGTRNIFGNFYAGGNSTPAQRPRDSIWFACALGQPTIQTYQACIKAPTPRLRRSKRL